MTKHGFRLRERRTQELSEHIPAAQEGWPREKLPRRLCIYQLSDSFMPHRWSQKETRKPVWNCFGLGQVGLTAVFIIVVTALSSY